MWKEYRLKVQLNGNVLEMLNTKSLREAYEAAEKWQARGHKVELMCHHVHVIDLDFNYTPEEEDPF